MYFKDLHPNITVSNIKEYLTCHNIIVEEFWHKHTIGVFSLTVRIRSTSIIANGKGVTRELALASAYGELIERLSHFAHFRMNNMFYYFDNKYYDRDCEKMEIPKDKLISNYLDDWSEKTCFDISKIKHYLSRIIKLSSNEKIKLQTFLSTDDKLCLPSRLVDIFYGTNGMASGNTEYEAKVQAISEVIERYAFRKILKNDLSMTFFDTSLLKNKNLIEECFIDNKFSKTYKVFWIKIYLFDKINILGLLLINSVNGKAILKIGVHPIMEIAAERCITELFQGKSTNGFDEYLRTMDMPSIRIDNNSNLYNIIKDGFGHLPITILDCKRSYEWHEHYSELSNKEIFCNICKVLEDKGHKVYIQDRTYNSPLYTYQIVIPGISEILNHDDIDYFKKLYEKEQISKYLRNLKTINSKKIEHLLELLNKRKDYKSSITLDNVDAFYSLNKPNYYSNITVSQLKTLLYLKMEDYQKALGCLQKEGAEDSYYVCFEYYLVLYLQGIIKERIVSTLEKIFNRELVQQVVEDFYRDPFSYLPDTSCLEHSPELSKCNDCVHIDTCYIQNERFLMFKLMDIFNYTQFEESKV